MTSFIARDGQFWLDGQPVLVQAGEFHYYRTSADQWEHRLGLLKAAGFNAVASYIPWLWHQLDEGVSDFDGSTHPMRNLESYLDLAARMGFLIIARPGPYIMAETINEGIPQWVFQKYPQVAFVSQDQTAQNVVSYNHPDFLRCVQGWYKEIFRVLTPRQVTHGGRIIMVQLDNEMGMIAWVRNIIDTNPDTIERLAAYVRSSYGERIHERYPAGDLAEFLRAGIVAPGEPYGQRILDDYRRFYREYLREYTTFLLKEARSAGMDTLPVINIHGFANGGKPFPIGLSQLINVMRIDGMISATDVYPGRINDGNYHELVLVNEITRALQNPAQPLFSIEFQAGGNHDFGDGDPSLFDLHSRLVLSVGMRAINHYLFVSGENDPLLSPVKRHDWGHPVRQDGTLRRHYHRYPKLSRVLHSYGQALTRSQPQHVTTIGFLLDYFMTEVTNRVTQEAANILAHQRGEVLFDFLAKGLSATHRPYNVIELASGSLDPGATPTLWVMMEKQCSALVQQKLVDYIRAGGRLVIAGRMCVEDFDRRPCTIIKDALGIREITSDAPWEGRDIRVFHYRDVPVRFAEAYSGSFDEVFAVNAAGGAVGFSQILGAGKAFVFGAAVPANTLDDIGIITELASRVDCQPLFRLDDWLDCRICLSGQGNFLFAANYQHDPIETTVVYAGKPLFGGQPVHLPARRGLILPLEWQVREGIRLDYCTGEVTEVAEQDSLVTLRVEPQEFFAGLTLDGYAIEQAGKMEAGANHSPVTLHNFDGVILLRKLSD